MMTKNIHIKWMKTEKTFRNWFSRNIVWFVYDFPGLIEGLKVFLKLIWIPICLSILKNFYSKLP